MWPAFALQSLHISSCLYRIYAVFNDVAASSLIICLEASFIRASSSSNGFPASSSVLLTDRVGTHEEEVNKSLPFLDVKVSHNDNGSNKLSIYRKPTHTDQYLLWSSEHPTAHKMSVARTLMDRAVNVITDPQELIEEEKQYPKWITGHVKDKILNRSQTNKGKKSKKTKSVRETSRGWTSLPYIRGITERIQRSMAKHKIHTTFKPHTTLRKLLVHPKDKIDKLEKCNVIYELPCKSCKMSYIGETGRKFNTRLNEHMKECKKETRRKADKSEETTKQQSSKVREPKISSLRTLQKGKPHHELGGRQNS